MANDVRIQKDCDIMLNQCLLEDEDEEQGESRYINMSPVWKALGRCMKTGQRCSPRVYDRLKIKKNRKVQEKGGEPLWKYWSR